MSNNYPKPDDDIESNITLDEYFLSIMQNEELPTEIRLKAAMEFGTLNYLIKNSQQKFMRLSIAGGYAIDEYKKLEPNKLIS